MLAECVPGSLLQGFLLARTAAAQARSHIALVLQQVFRDRPAAIQFAYQVAFGYLHVVEEGLAERRGAADQLDGGGAHPQGRHVEQEETDAIALRCLRIGAHQAEDPVRQIGVGGPDLGTVHQEVVAHILCRGLQAGEVRARARLAVALAPANFTAGNFRQVLKLLCFSGEFEQRRCKHDYTEAGERRPATEARHLLAQHTRAGGIQPRTAVGARPFRYGVAAGGHALEPEFLLLALEHAVAAAPAGVLVAAHRLAHAGGAIHLQPLPQLIAETFRCVHACLCQKP